MNGTIPSTINKSLSGKHFKSFHEQICKDFKAKGLGIMEEKEEKITLFILGDIKTEKGHYLARIIKTQRGVYETRFEPRTNTVKVKYNPTNISKEKIERLSYISDCTFVSDKHDIEKQIWFLQTQRTLKRLLQISSFVSIVFSLYFICCFIVESSVAHLGYICLVVPVFISAVTYYLYKKIKERRFTEQNNMEIKYSEPESINSF